MDTTSSHPESGVHDSKKRKISQAQPAAASAAKKPNNTSYRHLFSVGEETPPLSAVPYRRPRKRFSLFGYGKAVFPGHGPRSMRMAAEDDTWEDAHDDNADEPPQETERASPDQHAHAADADNRTKDTSPVNDRADDHHHQPTARNDDAYVTTGAQDSENKPEFQIPSDIFSRPAALEEIATMFVRQKPIEQLDEEWSAPGGIRDQVRHEFKVRRQKAASTRSTAPAPVG